MSEPFLGEIRICSFNFPPKGWALCNGQLLPINQNQALFAIMGTTYGGNGQTNFALPNFRGRIPVHWGDGVNLGQTGGAESHTLNLLEMPGHEHVPLADPNPPTQVSPAGHLWAAQSANGYTTAPSAPAPMSPQAISPVGGNQPHYNMPPYLVLNFIIALQGLWPSQF
jgi:microcystin-dependent protein